MVLCEVVNCFRSFTYWPLSQLREHLPYLFLCCELLSFFHLLTFVTVKGERVMTAKQLWIAFVLSLIDLCHSRLPRWYCLRQVVNCFRSFTYWPLSQYTGFIPWPLACCELLSFFHLLTFVTVIIVSNVACCKLWIAFVLSLIDLCHSNSWNTRLQEIVVNCFRSFTYWPLSQFKRNWSTN